MPPIIPKLRKPQPWLRKFTRPEMATYEHVVCAPPISEPSKSLPDLELAYLNLVSLYEQQLADANKTRKRVNDALNLWTDKRLAICDPARHSARAAK